MGVASVIRSACVVALCACGFQRGSSTELTPTDDGNPSDTTQPPPDDAAGDAPRDAPGDAPQDGALATTCPANYMTTATGKYRKVATLATWLAAEQDCENDLASNVLHTHLVVIDTNIEAAAIAGSDFPWLGATDLPDEGDAVFVTAQLTVWTTPLVDNHNFRDCVRIRDDAAFVARDCDETNKYVCECDAFAASASRYPNLPDGN